MENSSQWEVILSASYKGCLGREDFRGFREAASDAVRVTWCRELAAIWSNDLVHGFIQKCMEQSSKGSHAKSEDQSMSWRKRGSVSFQKKRYNEALSCYTQSVLTAPHSSKGQDSEIISAELATAFGNRSAALYHLGQYELAVQDCDRAVSHGYPSMSVYKVLHRKGQCLSKLGQDKQAMEVLEQALAALDEAFSVTRERKDSLKSDIEKLIHSCSQSRKDANCKTYSEKTAAGANEMKKVDELTRPSKILAGASQSLGLQCCKDRGRFLVAESPVRAGELVIREMPYAVILLPEYHATHCHHCCRRTMNPIPCPECTDVQYCSDQCLRSALESHHWLECGLWDGLKLIGNQAWLSLRMLLQAKSWCNIQHVIKETSTHGASLDPSENFKTDPQSSEVNCAHEEVEPHGIEAPRIKATSPCGCGRDGCYRSDYMAVYHLMPHAENHSVQELFNLTMTALLLTKCIQMKLHQSSHWRPHFLVPSTTDIPTDHKPRQPVDRKGSDQDQAQGEDAAETGCSELLNSRGGTLECGCKLDTSSEPRDSWHNSPGSSVTEEVAALLLRHMQQLKCNAHAVTTIQTLEGVHPSINKKESLEVKNSRQQSPNTDETVSSRASSGQRLKSDTPVDTRVDESGDKPADTVVDTTRQVRLATAVYPTASLLNHACKPNVIASFDGAVLTMRATKDIQVGEEVLHCYGPHAKHMSREERQKALQDQYFFTCTCDACGVTPAGGTETCDWSRSYRCPKCGGPLVQTEGKKKVGLCVNRKCRNTQSLREISKEAERAANLFKLSRHLMECKQIEECLGILYQCYNIQREVLYRHHKSLAETQDCLAKCYSIMGDFKQSGKYLRLSVATVEKQYGSESIELAHELHKLAQVLFNGGEVQDTLLILDRAIKLLTLHYGPNHQDVQEMTEMRTCLLSL